MVEAAYQAGIPSVWIIHESYTDAQMRALHSPYALNRVQNAFSLADRSLIASHSTARLFAPCDYRHRIEVIHNGLEAEAIEEYIAQTTPAEAKRLLNEPAGRKRIIAVGTVCERKGQHTLVEAAAQLAAVDALIFWSPSSACATSLSYVNTIPPDRARKFARLRRIDSRDERRSAALARQRHLGLRLHMSKPLAVRCSRPRRSAADRQHAMLRRRRTSRLGPECLSEWISAIPGNWPIIWTPARR